MRVTPPIPITPAKLISSNASVIHAPAAYNSGTTYAYGAIVSVAADFKIYESIASANIGNTPLSEPLWWRILGPTETAYAAGTTYAIGATASGTNNRVYESLQAANIGNPLPVLPETETAWWIDVGPMNKWAMFDTSRNTQTVSSGALTVVIKPGSRINTIGLTGLSANTLTVSATSVLGGGAVYGPVTKDLNTRVVNDGYSYAFEPFSTQPSWALFDLPPYSDIIVTITVTATSGNTKCGAIVLGNYIYLGSVQQGATNDALNFSTIDRDLYGGANLVPRRSVPKTNQTLILDSIHVNKVRNARTAVNAVPALYTGLDDGGNDYFDMLAIMGVYKQFVIDATHTKQATVHIEIEEI